MCFGANIQPKLNKLWKIVIFDRFSWFYEVFQSLFDFGLNINAKAYKGNNPCALLVSLTPLASLRAHSYRFEWKDCPIRLCELWFIWFGSNVVGLSWSKKNICQESLFSNCLLGNKGIIFIKDFSFLVWQTWPKDSKNEVSLHALL